MALHWHTAQLCFPDFLSQPGRQSLLCCLKRISGSSLPHIDVSSLVFLRYQTFLVLFTISDTYLDQLAGHISSTFGRCLKGNIYINFLHPQCYCRMPGWDAELINRNLDVLDATSVHHWICRLLPRSCQCQRLMLRDRVIVRIHTACPTSLLKVCSVWSESR